MIRLFLSKLRRYPLSCLCIATIWVLCFGTMPSTPLDDVTLIDKWVHITMYCGTCMVIWGEYIFRHKHVVWRKLAVWAWLVPVLMSAIIELLQAYCTNGRRSGDWLDFAANTIGATLGAIIGMALVRITSRKRQG